MISVKQTGKRFSSTLMNHEVLRPINIPNSVVGRVVSNIRMFLPKRRPLVRFNFALSIQEVLVRTQKSQFDCYYLDERHFMNTQEYIPRKIRTEIMRNYRKLQIVLFKLYVRKPEWIVPREWLGNEKVKLEFFPVQRSTCRCKPSSLMYWNM